jgi:acetyl esterase/lipase
MIKHLAFTILLFFCLAGNASAQHILPIWPDREMPNSKGMALDLKEERERITQVDKPTMHVFLPSTEENIGTAVLIFPPGGYQKLTYNIAGYQLAKWFNTMGISAFVLMYRLPNSPDLVQREIGPLQDAQRAMKLIRANAEQWKIDSKKVGAMGCSAGGHLATTLGTYLADESKIGDKLDTIDFWPNFIITVSPVITMFEFTHKGSKQTLLGDTPSPELAQRFSNELQVNAKTPPCFMVHAADDKTASVQNSLLFYQALVRLNITSSLHIFPTGGHNIALRNNPGSTNQWTSLCEAWLHEMGFLP